MWILNRTFSEIMSLIIVVFSIVIKRLLFEIRYLICIRIEILYKRPPVTLSEFSLSLW